MSLRIDIYTDGACSGNPGKGGYGIVMKVPEKNYERRFSKGFRLTTNNRMELLAVIVALEKLKSPDNDIHVFTDSKYVVDAITQKWIYGWVRKGFKNVKNPDLWQRMIPLLKLHQPTFHWVKGHAGHLENEICDQLAVKAAQSAQLDTDVYFENLKNGKLFGENGAQ
ncbi:ribonuclease HI [Chryseobacterium sp. 6424]|uniref:ribonuclease HI n=1 Tax=Chryseobacterium sp. 6424 TaxID=2039166 RepID=UPI000EFB7DB2|nr:ribonuclease HI [Chryseobacterium sp. 6424]AYO58583.1 ribonuclease HI [Chryseobacterium sp. 6424]